MGFQEFLILFYIVLPLVCLIDLIFIQTRSNFIRLFKLIIILIIILIPVIGPIFYLLLKHQLINNKHVKNDTQGK